MADIQDGAPAKEQFNFVLVHPEWGPIIAFHFHAYDEVAVSRRMRMHGKEVHALFPFKETTRDRAMWQGWKDVTDEYFRDPALFEIPLDQPVPRSVAEVADRSMASWKDRILTALAIKGPKMQKGAILDATGMPDLLYGTLMPALLKDGLVKKIVDEDNGMTFYELVL